MPITAVIPMQMISGIWGSAPKIITLGSMIMIKDTNGTSDSHRAGRFFAFASNSFSFLCQ